MAWGLILQVKIEEKGKKAKTASINTIKYFKSPLSRRGQDTLIHLCQEFYQNNI